MIFRRSHTLPTSMAWRLKVGTIPGIPSGLNKTPRTITIADFMAGLNDDKSWRPRCGDIWKIHARRWAIQERYNVQYVKTKRMALILAKKALDHYLGLFEAKDDLN